MLNGGVISIVDDDESVCLGTMDLMQSMGYVAETFTRPEDFLKSGHLQRTRCLIADVQMPGMNGHELHDYLVRSGHVIPTILITAFPKETDRERALQCGVAGYLVKPFGACELLACIRAAVREPAVPECQSAASRPRLGGGFGAWAYAQGRPERKR